MRIVCFNQCFNNFVIILKKMKSYFVVEFDDNTISVVPSNWVRKENLVVWPPKCSASSIRQKICRMEEPAESWQTFKMKKLTDQLSYNQALKKEKSLSDVTVSESSVSDSTTNAHKDEVDFNSDWNDSFDGQNSVLNENVCNSNIKKNSQNVRSPDDSRSTHCNQNNNETCTNKKNTVNNQNSNNIIGWLC